MQIFDNPVADFLNTEVCFGDTVSFTDSFSSNVTSWIYNFGDSIGFSTDNNPIYVYQNHGDFNVKLNVIPDMGCEDSILKKLVVINFLFLLFLLMLNRFVMEILFNL